MHRHGTIEFVAAAAAILSKPVVRWSALSLYVAAAGWLVARAFAGALVRPLEPLAFIFATSATLWLGFLVWVLVRGSAGWVPTRFLRQTSQPTPQHLASGSSPLARIKPAAGEGDASAARGSSWPRGPHWDRAPSHIRQEFVRTQLPTGRESIDGTVRVSFAAGQARAVEHLAFCPPLATLPEIECRGVAGDRVTVRVEQRTTFGARLELRLSDPCDEPHSVVLHFQVRG